MNRIVVVGDDPVQRQFVVRCLASRGHRVIVAGNGEEGLAQILLADAAVVVSDIHMSGLDGFGMADTLRREPGLRKPDIIFMFSDTERNLYRRAFQLSVGAVGISRGGYYSPRLEGCQCTDANER